VVGRGGGAFGGLVTWSVLWGRSKETAEHRHRSGRRIDPLLQLAVLRDSRRRFGKRDMLVRERERPGSENPQASARRAKQLHANDC
jgi:hypothetical protein